MVWVDLWEEVDGDDLTALYQPLDSDLTAIAALTTDAAGRSILILTDPGGDRIAFWDDSAGTIAWLTAGTGLTITDTTITASGGSLCVTGSYTGDGGTGQVISGLGITPKYVKIWRRETTPATVIAPSGGPGGIWETTAEILDDEASFGSIVFWDPGDSGYRFDDDAIVAFGAGSFTVDDAGADQGPNANSIVYNFLAIGTPT